LKFKSYYWAIGAAIGVLVVVLAILPFLFGGDDQNNKSPHSAEDLAQMTSDPVDYSPQIEAYQDLIAENPNDAEAYVGLGTVYIDTGNFSEAVDQLNKAIEIDPNQDLAYDFLGIALFQMGNADGAIEQFNKGLEVKPDSQVLLIDLGAVYAQTGKQDDAINLWQQAYDVQPGNEWGHMAKELINQQQNPDSGTEAPPLS
jgi:tetratricopeptide (TPR) repeat protein